MSKGTVAHAHQQAKKKKDKEKIALFEYIFKMGAVMGEVVADLPAEKFDGLKAADTDKINLILNDLEAEKKKQADLCFNFQYSPDKDLEGIDKRLGTVTREIALQSRDRIRQELEASIARYSSALYDYRDILDSLDKGKGFSKDFKNMVRRLEEDGFYRLVPADKIGNRNDNLHFVTAPITLSEYNPRAGINLSVDMGQFLVCYRLQSGDVLVKPFRNNIKVGSNWHPHVSSSGRLCWGDAVNRAVTYAEQRDLYSYMSLLHALLTTYSPENPYKHLKAFDDNKTNRQKYISYKRFQYELEGKDIYNPVVGDLVHMDGVNGVHIIKEILDGGDNVRVEDFSGVSRTTDTFSLEKYEGEVTLLTLPRHPYLCDNYEDFLLTDKMLDFFKHRTERLNTTGKFLFLADKRDYDFENKSISSAVKAAIKYIKGFGNLCEVCQHQTNCQAGNDPCECGFCMGDCDDCPILNS